MSRLPPFIRKNAAKADAIATVATTATERADCSNNSERSSSSPPNANHNAAPAVASIATVAVATAASGGSIAPSREARRWVAEYAARAAVAEFRHGASRAEAERQAFACVVALWRCEHPPEPTEPADGCVQCGLPMGDDAVAMLAGGGHAWRHRACWKAYDERRQSEAEAAIDRLLGQRNRAIERAVIEGET